MKSGNNSNEKAMTSANNNDSMINQQLWQQWRMWPIMADMAKNREKKSERNQ